MKKQEFLDRLTARLAPLSEEERNTTLEYYDEMIRDRMEDGLSEEDAIDAIGDIEDISPRASIIAPFRPAASPAKHSSRRLRTGEIVLLVLGSPIWLPLLLAAVIVVLAVYIVLWAGVICLYAAEASFFAGSLSGLMCTVLYAVRGEPDAAVFFFACALALAGLSILWWFVCSLSAKGAVRLGSYTVRRTVSCCRRKEGIP